MGQNAKELIEKRANLYSQMRAMVDASDAEDRDFTAEENVTYGKMEKDLDALGARAARATELEKREAAAAVETRAAGGRLHGVNGGDAGDGEKRAAEYRSAFDQYLRRGIEGMDPEAKATLKSGVRSLDESERRDLSRLTGGAGNFLAPVTLEKSLIKPLQLQVAVRAAGASVLQTGSGEDILWPRVAAYAADSSILAETSTLSFVDETFDQVSLKAFMYPTGTKVSIQLLQDNVVDLEAFLSERLPLRIARAQDNHFINGTGTSQPRGFLLDAAIAKTGATGQTLTVTYDDLIDVMYGVARPYRVNGSWIANDAILKAARKIKDSTGQPIWQIGMQADEPDRMLGKPVVVSEFMPTPAANAKSIAFGDFSKYQIREVQGISVRRLDERYAEQFEVAFIAWQRADGVLADVNAVKVYAHSAT